MLLLLSLLELEFRLFIDEEIQVLVLGLLIGQHVTLLTDLLLELADIVSQLLLLRVRFSDLRFVGLAEALKVLQKFLVSSNIVLTLHLAFVA